MTTNQKFRLALVAGTAFCAIAIATSAAAQQAAAGTTNQNSSAGAAGSSPAGSAPSDIVVTAQKRAERVQDIPEAIQALTSKTLTARGVVSLDDLGRQTPGLTLSQRQNNTPDVTVRGIGAFGAVQGVGFYIDDVQNFTDQVMRLEDVDRVEVLKGPQGTLYGGSSLGGAIRYISKTPSFSPSGEIEVEGGTNDYENVYAAINGPVLPGIAAVRVSGYYDHDGGFIHDINLKEQSDEASEYGVRAQLLITPNDKLTALFTVRTRQQDTGLGYVPDNSVTAPSYTSDLPVLPHQHINVVAAVANISYNLGFATLTSISSATSSTYHSISDVTYKLVDEFAETQGRPVDVYTEELRLTSQKGGMFDWIVGAYAIDGQNTLLAPTPINLILPTGAKLFPYNSYETTQTDLALFGTGNLHFGNFTLTGGVRINHTEFNEFQFAIGGKKTNVGMSLSDPVVAIPKVTLSYEMPEGPMLYASIAEGYEAGKIDPSTNPVHPYRPEIDWTYEFGAKGYLFEHQLYYEGDIYYINEDDRQVQSTIVDSQGVASKPLTNIGNSTSKGAEGHLDWYPIPGLTLTGGVSYLDAVWDKGAVYSGVSVAGRTPPNSPRWTANLAGTYTVPVSSSLNLTLHADASYTDPYEWSLAYIPISGINPAYWIVFSRIAIGPKDGRWELSGRVDNVFNQKYYTEFNPAFFGPQLPNGTCNQCALGAPGELRRFTAALTVKF